MAIFKRKSRPPAVVVITSAPAGVALHGRATSYTELYASSFAVRATVDFIARHLSRYEVTSYMDDKPLTKDQVRELFRNPASGIGRYELLEFLVVQLLVTGNAYGPLITDTEDRVRGISPTAATVSLERPTGGPPIAYKLATPGGIVEVAVADMLHFRLANPRDPFVGLSPLDSVRALLAEEQAASASRTAFWRDSARREGVIEQTVDAPRMSDEARESFLIDIEDALSGEQKGGKPLILEPGQSWKESSWSPREAEFVSARAQTLQLVSGAYGVPSQLVNSSTENLPAAVRATEEVLAPYAELIESAINAQLVPRVYGEQAVGGRITVRLVQPSPPTDRDIGGTLDGAVKSGRMTANESRAIVGLPSHPDGDSLSAAPPQGGGAP